MNHKTEAKISYPKNPNMVYDWQYSSSEGNSGIESQCDNHEERVVVDRNDRFNGEGE